jgi:hypothetical protein
MNRPWSEWTEEQREKHRATSRRTYERNKAKRNAEHKAYVAANPERIRAAHRKRVYKLSPEDFTAKMLEQNSRCAICRNEFVKTPNVDHDSNCCPDKMKTCGKCVRGILCGDCNRALGLFDHDLERLQAAIDYLLKFSKPKSISIKAAVSAA